MCYNANSNTYIGRYEAACRNAIKSQILKKGDGDDDDDDVKEETKREGVMMAVVVVDAFKLEKLESVEASPVDRDSNLGPVPHTCTPHLSCNV